MRRDALDEVPLERPQHEVAVCLDAVECLEVVGLREGPPPRTRAPSSQHKLQCHDVLQIHVPREVANTPSSRSAPGT